MTAKTLAEVLSPENLAKIDNYHLIAKIVVEGFISGLHRSVYRGVGGEFLQYRSYSPGDDLKYIDWKVFGRRDKFYTKIFQEETNFNCTLILDASASMAYRGKNSPCSKFQYGAMLAASLAYIAARQGDNVGFFSYSDFIHAHLPPAGREGKIHRIINAIGGITPSGHADHDYHLNFIAASAKRRGLVVIISDFLDMRQDMSSILKNLRIPRNDCIVVHVLDKDEVDFPFTGSVRFIDSENSSQIVTAPQTVRNDYLKSLDAFMASVKKSCVDANCDYIFTDNSQNLGAILAAYLHHRGAVY